MASKDGDQHSALEGLGGVVTTNGYAAISPFKMVQPSQRVSPNYQPCMSRAQGCPQGA